MYIRVIGEDIKNFKNKDIILFGCGSCGIRALEEFEKIGAHILGFCDNNKNLFGSKINSYDIMGPDKLIQFKDASIIITSTFEDEIEHQLKEMNINQYYKVKVGVLKEMIPRELFYNKFLSNEETNQYLYNSLCNDKPFFVGRLGSVELECLSHYLYLLDRSKMQDYPENVKMIMNINAGFFPCNSKLLDEFCELYLDGLKSLDLIWSMWFSKYEDMIYKSYCKDVYIADYDKTVMPLNSTMPWTLALKGKRILVIHPFEDSIKENFTIKDKLFNRIEFIPDFELITLKSVQSIANNETGFENWFDALQFMQNQIDKIDFDIALIGAGAYGFALGAYIKSIGKKAVHIGGMLQLFFGIKGKAWDKLNIYNEYWTSPKTNEKPMNYISVEAGRYW